MAITRDHDLHRRRFGRNLGVGLALVALAALVFGLTVVKVSNTGPVQGFDHTFRPELATEPAREAGQ